MEKYSENKATNYLHKFYLVVETMTSVGYGDDLPITLYQHIVAIITMCFAAVLFGNIIGNIQGFIESFQENDKFYENILRKLKNHLRENKLPPEFRQRVTQYVYFLKSSRKKNDLQEIGFLEALSKPLQEEIFTQTRGYLLAKSAVFRNYSGAFLKYLGHAMKVEVFAPADQLFKEGDMSNIIYYLCSGSVQIFHEATKTVFKDIKKNKYFGEISFFLDTCRTASAMCLDFSEFLTIDRKTFFRVLQSRPKELGLTNVIIHNTETYQNLGLLGIRCYLCLKMGHVAKNCKKYMYESGIRQVVKQGDRKKHSKTININTMPGSNFRRQAIVSNRYDHYDCYNTLGKPFTPGSKFMDNPRIIVKAWALESKIGNLLHIDRLGNSILDAKSNYSDSDSEHFHESGMIGEEKKLNKDDFESSGSSISEYQLTFGKELR